MKPPKPADGRTVRAGKAREARRSQILDASLAEFARRGYHRTSVADLVEAAGVARGTFYLYFDSKQVIFQELLNELTGELKDAIRGVDVAPGAPPIEVQLRTIIADLLRAAFARRDLARVVFHQAVGADDDADRVLKAFYGDLALWLEGSLRVGQALGWVRPLDPHITALCCLGMLRQVLVHHLIERDDTPDYDAVAGTLVEFALRGIAAPP
jgi:AcrR family transcriptional regulator